MPVLAQIKPEYILFGSAGIVSLIAFAALVLVPVLGSYGRGWERVAAAFVSLFVLASLALMGVLAGLAIVYFWDDIQGNLL